jgi:hypothetical protein
VLTDDGGVALLRGRRFDDGEKFDCDHKETRNWVSVYNPKTKAEHVLFDRTIPFDGGQWKFCVFEQMQLSPGGSVLYLVSPVYATSGSLAIIHLRGGLISYVPGVNQVFVIETGPHRGELIYQRRMYRRISREQGEYPYYPFVHARPNGVPIHVISEEFFTVGGDMETPILKSYLRTIGGLILVNGKSLP